MTVHFSPREQDILHLLAQYRTYAQIADILGMRKSTVYSHTYIMFRKVHVHNQLELVAYAVEHGYGKKGDE